MVQCMCKMMLDVAEHDTVQSIVARQGDSATRFLRLRLAAYGEPMRVEESVIVVLNAKNSVGEVRSFEGEVNADGTVTLPITAWMLQTIGVLQCDVSLFDVAGGKLTSPMFEVEVVASVAADETLPGDDAAGESITARLLAEERVFDLLPVVEVDGYSLQPACNRKYALDLSGENFTNDRGNWRHISLVLPAPEDSLSDNWILIYCHAPLRGVGGVSIDWGDVSSILFAEGVIPEILKGDFDIICTYSRAAGKWQIGTVQYEAIGGAV